MTPILNGDHPKKLSFLYKAKICKVPDILLMKINMQYMLIVHCCRKYKNDIYMSFRRGQKNESLFRSEYK